MSYGMGSATGQSRSESLPKGYGKYKLNNYTPEQMQLFRQQFAHLGPDSYLSKLAGGDEETFNQIEKPALQQFTGIQGGLASRFSGMGLGGRKSSGFQHAQTAAASDFASQLQSQRQSLQQQAIKDLLGLSNDLLGQRPYEQGLVQKQNQPSWWEQLLGGGLPLAGAAGGYFASGGNPFAAQLGYRAGQAGSQAFM
jgi:hypothetical protein